MVQFITFISYTLRENEIDLNDKGSVFIARAFYMM